MFNFKMKFFSNTDIKNLKKKSCWIGVISFIFLFALFSSVAIYIITRESLLEHLLLIPWTIIICPTVIYWYWRLSPTDLDPDFIYDSLSSVQIERRFQWTRFIGNCDYCARALDPDTQEDLTLPIKPKEESREEDEKTNWIEEEKDPSLENQIVQIIIPCNHHFHANCYKKCQIDNMRWIRYNHQASLKRNEDMGIIEKYLLEPRFYHTCPKCLKQIDSYILHVYMDTDDDLSTIKPPPIESVIIKEIKLDIDLELKTFPPTYVVLSDLTGSKKTFKEKEIISTRSQILPIEQISKNATTRSGIIL